MTYIHEIAYPPTRPCALFPFLSRPDVSAPREKIVYQDTAEESPPFLFASHFLGCDDDDGTASRSGK